MLALLDRVVPVLDSDDASIRRVVRRRGVTGDEDPRIVRCKLRVRDDAACPGVQSRRLGKAGVGFRPEAGDHERRRQLRPIVQNDPLDSPGSNQAGHPSSGQRYPIGAMDGRDGAGGMAGRDAVASETGADISAMPDGDTRPDA